MALNISEDTKFIRIRTKESEETCLTNDIIIHGPFMNIPDLVEVVVPERITLIDEEAFMDCKSLTTVTLPSTIQIIRRNAFFGCKNLQNVILPDSISEIECWDARRVGKVSLRKPFTGLAGYLQKGLETEFNPPFNWD